MRRVAVFCGASVRVHEKYLAAAQRLGEVLAGEGLELVYGGSSVGLMGRIADSVIDRNGQVFGIIPQHLVDRELAHQRISELRVVPTMHERKALMHELADAYIALPGGLGTLEELFETLAWAGMGLHRKPVALLDVDGYFQPLLEFLRHGVDEGFVRAEDLALVILEDDPAELVRRLRARLAQAV